MAKGPKFVTIGKESEKIDVKLNYGIVRLFSEGLYASPNKAIEELVANSFDAGSKTVTVIIPVDLRKQGATIAVLDNGEGMNVAGLKQHWLIGKSYKRKLSTLPLGRSQIGQFGIGKLASYVLANRLTHISKKNGKFYSTSLDFAAVDRRGEEEIEVKTPVQIALRILTEDEAKTAVKEWSDTDSVKASGAKLFGAKAEKSWTLAILSDLKDKAYDIELGRVKWILRTALPLRDDFSILLNEEKLTSSRSTKGRVGKWVLGKSIKKLSKPATNVQSTRDKKEKDPEKQFALQTPSLGRITGYAEAYREPFTTTAKNTFGRSHGFFVYVRGRLINVDDGHFGIAPNELQHGTFSRIRVVVNMDGLDNFLQSNRENIRQVPALKDAQNILRAVFNWLRAEIKKSDDAEDPGKRLGRKFGASPSSLARRPIIELARSVLAGKIRSRYLSLPSTTTKRDQEKLIAALEKRAETPENFVDGIDFVFDGTPEDGIAIYDAATGRLRINGLHPFVGSFFDEFTSKTSGLPLEVFAMAEVLLEAHLNEGGLSQDQIDDVMSSRDQLLRHVAKESGRMTPLMVANALRNAKNDQDLLEIWVVEAFRSLGFESTRISGPGKPDGLAEAQLAPDAKKQPQHYKVSLEAKSKQKDGAKVSAKSVDTAGIARHRKDFDCDHAIVVGQLFPTKQKEISALSKQISEDRRLTKAEKKPRTITLIHIEDLANLVQHRPVKDLTLQRIREMLISCSLPEECKVWVDKIIAEHPVRHDYATIVKTIARLQTGPRMEPVEHSELRAELRHGSPKIDYADLGELRAVCDRMAGLAPGDVETTNRTVALNQSVSNILVKLEAATKEHLRKTP